MLSPHVNAVTVEPNGRRASEVLPGRQNQWGQAGTSGNWRPSSRSNRFVALFRSHLWFHSTHECAGMDRLSGECRFGRVTCNGGLTSRGAGS
jgi:hypothetical protein